MFTPAVGAGKQKLQILMKRVKQAPGIAQERQVTSLVSSQKMDVLKDHGL